MADQKLPEVWLRGPVDGVPPLLQPVAHALLEAREEVNEMMKNFPEDKLWERPAGLASTGFHLQHLSGVLDRLFTYAEGKTLSDQQWKWLQSEGRPEGALSLAEMLQHFNGQVDRSLEQLKTTPESSLTQSREVGRVRLPSTVMGLLFHAAEHTMRHTGQLLVTSRVITQGKNPQTSE